MVSPMEISCLSFVVTAAELATDIGRKCDYFRKDSSSKDLRTEVKELSSVLDSLKDTLESSFTGDICAGTSARNAANLGERVGASAMECEKTLKQANDMAVILRDNMPRCSYQRTRNGLHPLQFASCPGSGISSGSSVSPKFENFGSKGCIVYAILITLSRRPLTIEELKAASLCSYDTMMDLLPGIRKQKSSSFDTIQQIVNKYLKSLTSDSRLSYEDEVVSHLKQQLADELDRLLIEIGWKSIGHEMIAITCMETIAECLHVPAYNSDAHIGRRNQPRYRNETTFLAYSITYWFHHCTDSNPQDQRLIRCIHGMVQSVFCAEKRHHHMRCNDVTSRDLDRALVFAAKYDFCALGKTYIEMGANFHRRSSQHGETALHLAVAHNSIGMVRILLEEGADRNAVDGKGFTPLLWAAFFGQTTVVQQLVDHGTDVNAAQALRYSEEEPCCDLSIPPLDPTFQWLFCGTKSVAFTDGCIFQMENKINDLSSHRSQAWTPLSIAACKGHVEVVELLLRLGAHDQSNGALQEHGSQAQTALSFAAFKGDDEVVKSLIQPGAFYQSNDASQEQIRQNVTKNWALDPFNTNRRYETNRRDAIRSRLDRIARYKEGLGVQRPSSCTSRSNQAIEGTRKAKRNRKSGRRQPQKCASGVSVGA